MPCAHLHPLGLTPKLPEAGVDLPTLGIKLQFLVQSTELTGRILEDECDVMVFVLFSVAISATCLQCVLVLISK